MICKQAGFLKTKGVHLSSEWMSCKIDSEATDRSKQLSALRGKIKQHVESNAHLAAERIHQQSKQNIIAKSVNKLSDKLISSTEKIFRTVYYIAKSNRPFSDHESLVELQAFNGIDLGITLHSRYSATEISDHLAVEMRERVVKSIIQNQSKIAVLVDESTTSGSKSALILHVKAFLGEGDPEVIFLELLELSSETAACVTDCILEYLQDHFTNKFLEEHWIAFISDGASVMLGKKSGVASRLIQKFPNLFIWHCMNHRLELAVGDAVGAVTNINHFKIFMDAVHNVYSMSPKNKRELSEICGELEIQFVKVGRVLGIRWAASSLRSVAAVWRTYSALCGHFRLASEDHNRDLRERQKYKGLLLRLQSPEMLCDLGLLYDVLNEMAMLSQELQKRNMTIPKANSCIDRTIRVLSSMKDNPGPKHSEALSAATKLEFRAIILIPNNKIKCINSKQFLQSLIDSLTQRMHEAIFNNQVVVDDLQVLDKSTWPEQLDDIRYGEAEITRLCNRFSVPEVPAILGMREYVGGQGDCDPENLNELRRAIKTIPCSTAECERGFSVMNLIATDTRSSLTTKHISNLMFLNINGPPIETFNPTSYTKTWIAKHRSADDTRSRQIQKKSTVQRAIWTIL
jgi:hypothetical protein